MNETFLMEPPDSFDKIVTRAWSLVRARGGDGSAEEIQAILTHFTVRDVELQLEELRSRGALP